MTIFVDGRMIRDRARLTDAVGQSSTTQLTSGPTRLVKLRKTDTEEFRTLRRRAARWRDDNIERLRGVEPHTPAALNDRAQDNWEPLFAIADLAGDSWARAARAAALKLSADAEMDVETTKTLLLSDTKGRPCDYCHEATDDPVQQVAYDGETLWLHPHCQRPFLDAQDDGLDIPECLRRY